MRNIGDPDSFIFCLDFCIVCVAFRICIYDKIICIY